jgi:hypothetical protein
MLPPIGISIPGALAADVAMALSAGGKCFAAAHA